VRFVQASVLLLGAASYLGVAAVLFGLSRSSDDLVPLIVGGWHMLLLLVAGLVILDSVRKVRRGRTSDLARDLFVVKLASIPYFLINFIVLSSIAFLGTSLAALVAASGIGETDFDARGFNGLALGLGGAAITISLTYLAMLTTSTYGWAAIAQLRRDGRINVWLAALYRVMLLLFVTDVVAGILLYVHARRTEVAS